MKEIVIGLILGALIALCLVLVSSSEAQACDEFHGDNNCTCEQSIFNPCCPPWEPWKCPAGGPAGQPASVLSPDEKAQLHKDADKMATGVKYFTFIAATARRSPDPIARLIAAAATAAATGAQLGEFYLRAAANDPWDAAFASPYAAPLLSPGQLGMEYCQGEGGLVWACNELVYSFTVIAQNGDGAYVSLNRSGSCSLLVNSGCFQWQGDRAREYLRIMGAYAQYAGWVFAVLRDEFMNNSSMYDLYSPEGGIPLSYALDQAAWSFWEAGQFLQSR